MERRTAGNRRGYTHILSPTPTCLEQSPPYCVANHMFYTPCYESRPQWLSPSIYLFPEGINKAGFGTEIGVGFITLHFRHLRFEQPNKLNHPHESRGKSQVLSEGESLDLSVLLSQKDELSFELVSLGWLQGKPEQPVKSLSSGLQINKSELKNPAYLFSLTKFRDFY